MIPPIKATKILKDYKANNFNAKKTLIENGYSEKTATQNAKKTLERADRAVKRALQLPEEQSLKETADVLELVGYSKEDVIKLLRDVIDQNRDFTNKLKAMQPLLRALNYNIDDNDVQKAPSVNITVEKVNTDNSGYIDVSGE